MVEAAACECLEEAVHLLHALPLPLATVVLPATRPVLVPPPRTRLRHTRSSQSALSHLPATPGSAATLATGTPETVSAARSGPMRLLSNNFGGRTPSGHDWRPGTPPLPAASASATPDAAAAETLPLSESLFDSVTITGSETIGSGLLMKTIYECHAIQANVKQTKNKKGKGKKENDLFYFYFQSLLPLQKKKREREKKIHKEKAIKLAP